MTEGSRTSRGRSILSGRVSAPLVPVLDPLLVLLSWPYASLLRLRNHLYDMKILQVRSPAVPVVSVGNITAGGTGKTPLVVALALEARRRGWKPAVISRGYRGAWHDGKWLNDEGLLLEQRVPELVVIQQPDRVAASQRAVEIRGADLILLDDAFQHRRMGRDVDLVTLDAGVPFDNGRVLPAGLLREPLTGIGRADAIVLTRCADAEVGGIEDRLRELSALAPGCPVFRTDHAPQNMTSLAGQEERPLSSLVDRRVFCCSAIARPESLEMTLRTLGAVPVGHRTFCDHFHYQPEDVLQVVDDARQAGADLIVTTAKDAVKLGGFEPARGFWVLHVALSFLGGSRPFFDFVFDRIERHPDRRSG